MPQFKFRLATLMKLREATRDERRAELAEAYQADQVFAQQRHELLRSIDDNRDVLRAAARPGIVSVDELLGGHRHQLLLAAQKQLLDQQRQQLQAEIDRRRQRLVDADREVKVLDKLRDRQQERFVHEEDRKEQKRLDEVAARCGPREDSA